MVLRLKQHLRISNTRDLMELMNLQDRTECNLLGTSYIDDPKIEKTRALFEMFGLTR